MAVRSKDARTNLVTEADTASEALIRRMIGETFGGDAVLGEEAGSQGDATRGRWLVDPLDGTVNFAHGYRCFCVSIAYERDGAVQFGVVYDPMADECFRGLRGGGADLNGSRLIVSECDALADAMLCTGFPVHAAADPIQNLGPFGDFMRRTPAIRRDGSAALDLCYVAAGRFDGFWEYGLHPWDFAAGWLIVEEAGGRVTDYRDGPMHIGVERMLATNGRIHGAMIDVLRGYA